MAIVRQSLADARFAPENGQIADISIGPLRAMTRTTAQFSINHLGGMQKHRWPDLGEQATLRRVRVGLERDDFSSNRHPALASCLSMIFSENRCPLFGIML